MPNAMGLTTPSITSFRQEHVRVASGGMRSQDDQGLIVVVAGSSFNGVRRSARGLAEALSEYSTVLYVDPPVSYATVLRASGRGNRRIANRLTRIAPRLYLLSTVVAPGKDRRTIHPLTQWLLRRSIRTALRRLGTSPDIVIVQNPHYRLLGRFGEDVSIYWSSDDFVAGWKLLGVDMCELCRREEAAASGADLVLVCSPVLAERWAEHGSATKLFPAAVDAERIEAEGADSNELDPRVHHLQHPIAVVAGHLSDRIDVDLLSRVARSGCGLLLVGSSGFVESERAFELLLETDNVIWVGEVDYSELAGYYRLADVGLVPYRDSEFNRASFPLKLLDYLAAGLPIVSTDLPSARWLGSPDVTIASTEEHFVEAVHEAVQDSNKPGLISRRKELAGMFTWEARAEELLKIVPAKS